MNCYIRDGYELTIGLAYDLSVLSTNIHSLGIVKLLYLIHNSLLIAFKAILTIT